MLQMLGALMIEAIQLVRGFCICQSPIDQKSMSDLFSLEVALPLLGSDQFTY